jgi:hypothetical protein
MSADVSKTVRQRDSCVQNRIKERTKTSYLKLFPDSSPLEYVFNDLLGPLPKTAHGNRFLLVMTDRFSEVTRMVPLRTTTTFVVAKVFCEHWVFCYGPPPMYFLTMDHNSLRSSFKPFAKNLELRRFLFCLSSLDEWASGTIQSDDC